MATRRPSFRAQPGDRQREALVRIGEGRQVVADLGCAGQDRHLDRERRVAGIGEARAQLAVQVVVGRPAPAVRDDDGAALVGSARVEAEEAMPALLIEPDRVADDQGGQCFLGEPCLALEVLRTGKRAEDSPHNADGESHIPVTETRRSGSLLQVNRRRSCQSQRQIAEALARAREDGIGHRRHDQRSDRLADATRLLAVGDERACRSPATRSSRTTG